MLSRRSVRIKVMQLLFSLSRDQDLSYKVANDRYWESIEKTYNLYLFNLYLLVQISKEALEDEKKKKKKHLPTELDKSFSAKLYLNPLVQSLVKNNTLQRNFEKLQLAEKANEDYFKKIYSEFAKQEAYVEFIKTEDSLEGNREILLELYRFCRKDEFFNETLEDYFPNWIDDKSVVIGAIKKSLKILPCEDPIFFKAYYPDQETTRDFGSKLFRTTFENDVELIDFIKPTLKNWDHERLAIIDMILLKMALCELIHFGTIPTKVTLNEYVEIAKMYSTAKSKDFINGVLDRMLKELDKEGRINKEGRGLIN